MTKPVIAAATMILVEECRLRLDDPVDDLLPELADRQVLRRIDGPVDDTVPAQRAVTVRDLLTFTFGFGQVFGPPELAAAPVQQAAHAARVSTGPQFEPPDFGPDEWLRRLGKLPLMEQPGASWIYHTGADVLAVLVARAAGQPLETFLRERIFEPLGMRDTGFFVPARKLERFASVYETDPETGGLRPHDDRHQFEQAPAFPSGGAGLVSTVDDSLAFGRMMLHGTNERGTRILSRATLDLMTTDQLTPAQKANARFAPGYFDGHGWGFGMMVVTQRNDVAAIPGRFGWDGGYGTSWASDPVNDVVAILCTQRVGWPVVWDVYRDFWTSVYQAVD
jgi:CubicO group peptidase (beta-lactamase class C family)